MTQHTTSKVAALYERFRTFLMPVVVAALTFSVLSILIEAKPEVIDRVELRPEFDGPFRGRAITGNPAVDRKRDLLINGFDFREPVETDYDLLISQGEISSAVHLAYLDEDSIAMQHIARQIGSCAKNPQKRCSWFALRQLVDAIDTTYLFEARAWELLEDKEAALTRYRQSLLFLREIEGAKLDQNDKNIARRLTLIRLKLFELEENIVGSSPFLDRMWRSFFEDYLDRRLHNHYLIENGKQPLPRAWTSKKMDAFDFCLERSNPHWQFEITGDIPLSCEIGAFEKRWGRDLFSAILQFNALHRPLRHPVPDPETATETASSTSELVPLSQLESFIEMVRNDVPKANFLLDDAIVDFLLPSPSDRDSFSQSNKGWQALSEPSLRRLVCSNGLVSENIGPTFDRYSELIEFEETAGLECR